MNFLVEIVPENYRRYLYATVAAVGLFLGAATVAGAQTFLGAPVATIQDVYAFVVTATGLIAYANTNASSQIVARRDDEEIEEN